VIDAPPGKATVTEYMRNETRFRMVERQDPERFRRLAVAAKDHSLRRVALYEQLAKIVLPPPIKEMSGNSPDKPKETADESFHHLHGFRAAAPADPGRFSLRTDNLDSVRRLEDAGAPMIVMHSLFEEQIVREEIAMSSSIETPKNSTPRRFPTFPSPMSSNWVPMNTWSRSAASRPWFPCR
jgi:hypothetical protein